MGNQLSSRDQHADCLVPASIDLSQRESMATWYRTDIAVTDVYEIMDTLGQAHMGDVYKVRRKVASRGSHNEETRSARNIGQGVYNSLPSGKPPTSGGSISSHGSGRRRFGNLNLSSHSNGGESVISFGSGNGRRRRFGRKKKENSKKLHESIDASSVHSAPVMKGPPSLSLKPPKPILRAPSLGNKSQHDDSDGNSRNCDGTSIFDLPKTLIAVANNIPNGSSDEDDITLNTNNEDDSIGPSGTFSNIIEPCISQGEIAFDRSPPTSATSSTTNVSGNDSLCGNSLILDQYEEEKNECDALPSSSNLMSPANSEVTTQIHNIRQVSDVSVNSIKSPGFGGWEDGVYDKSEYVPRRQVRFQRLYACKTVMTNQVKKDKLDELVNEIHIMRTLDHPFIIRLYEVYQVKRKLWLVMDLCTGGNLTSRKLNEAEVTVVLEQILRGVAYLHRMGICHRSLKLENILYENGSTNSSIRLIDFGLSQKYDRLHDSKEKEIGGTAYTLSPEIVSKSGPYTKKSDVWSVGIIVWVLLSGDYPFLRNMDELEDKDKKEKLIQARHRFGITWKGRGISDHAKEFVTSCLHRDPQNRWTASEALEFLQETWIPALQEKATKEDERIAAIVEASPKKNGKKQIIKKAPDDPTIVLKKAISIKRKVNDVFDINIEGIKKYSEHGQLKKTFLITMANIMDREEAGALRELFLYADTNHSGTITFDEFEAAMQKVEGQVTDGEQIEKLFSAIDQDQSGQIHFNEFVAALAESHGLITMDRLADVFDRIDTNGKGYISHDDLKDILGQSYDKKTVNEMIEEGDFKRNGQIDYDEFLHLMFDGQPATDFLMSPLKV